jgi:hypothetical protein
VLTDIFMNQETTRIADQLRRALDGDAWHGPSLKELLDGVNAEQASRRPLATGHTIWEIALHIEVYLAAGARVAAGGVMPVIFHTPDDWRGVAEANNAAWASTVQSVFDSGQRAADAIERFSDERLSDTVPGRDYDFYYLFHGLVQHSLFHGGQIAMLKRAVMALGEAR